MKKTNDCSPARLKYLKAQRKNAVIIWSMRFIILFTAVVLWELLTRVNVLDSFLFSSPTKIIDTILQLNNQGVLYLHVFTTLFETLIGFLIATVLGTLISIILWCSKRLKSILEPYIVVLNALPKIALGPIIIIAFGSGIKSIIFMTVLVTIIVTVINMLTGFEQTDRGKILLLQSMGATKLQILLNLVLPSALPTLISTLKVNVGLSWIGSIMGEYIVSKQGLGYLIVYGGQVLKLDLVMLSTVLLCILASLMYAFVLLLERLLVKWK